MADLRDVQVKEDALSALWARMDVDKDLYYLKKYVLADNKGDAVDGIINVTLNIPATFAAHVQSALMSATQQLVVASDPQDDDRTSRIEGIVRSLLATADLRLRSKGEATLRPFLTEQLDIRGRAAARVTMRKNALGQLITDIMPVDTRWFTSEVGEDRDGTPRMVWAAQKSWRSAASINQEYPGTNLLTTSKDLYGVTDFWDAEVNRIYIGSPGMVSMGEGREVFVQPNPYGMPPFAFQKVPLGSMLRDTDAVAHEGESIFFLIRDLVPEFNRLASIMQTLNLSSVQGPKQYASKEGPSVRSLPKNADRMGALTAVDIGGGFSLVPMGDLKQAGRLLHDILSRMIQSGSLSATAFGNLSFPLSAVALIELGEASGQVFLPRLGAKGLLYQQITSMMIGQLQKMGDRAFTIQGKGSAQSFTTKELEGDYDISYQYSVKTPTMDAALYTLAEAAARWLDDDTILRDLLRRENPAADRTAKLAQDAEELSPALRMYHAAKALMRQGDTVGARFLADELGVTLAELVSGKLEPPRKPKPQPARNLLPLMPGTRSASNSRANELMGEVREGPEEE